MTLRARATWRHKDLLDKGGISSVEIIHSVLGQIPKCESSIRAFITPRDELEVVFEAEQVDLRRKLGETIGVLAELPVAGKDNICTKGLRNSYTSKILSNIVPPYAATIGRRVRVADGIILGKTGMDEFAMGSSTENSAMAVTDNPHDLSGVPGATSGDSAAAVAGNETIFAIGSIAGGSIRQPASFCGLVGFKPTYGRVPRYGLIAYGSSLDQIGPLPKTVADAAMSFSMIGGHDPLDSTSLPNPVPDCASGSPPRQAFYRRPAGVLWSWLGSGGARLRRKPPGPFEAAAHDFSTRCLTKCDPMRPPPIIAGRTKVFQGLPSRSRLVTSVANEEVPLRLAKNTEATIHQAQ